LNQTKKRTKKKKKSFHDSTMTQINDFNRLEILQQQQQQE
jgi:hypothetical protein